MSKVYIGVGHGGEDSGAYYNGLKEKDLALSISKYCNERLIQYKIDTKMSRTTDKTVYIDTKVKESDAFGADVCLDIHINAGGGNGSEVYYSHISSNGKKLSNAIIDSTKAIGQNTRGIKTKLTSNGYDYFGMVRRPKAVSVLVECAFIDSEDVHIIDTEAERKIFGYAIADGIAKYFGTSIPAEPVKPASKPVSSPAKSSFLPTRGYFKYGDKSANIGKIASFMRKNFPSYTSVFALGNLFGKNLLKSVKEFQKRTGLEADGNIGPLTLSMLIKYGFKY